MIDFKTIDYLQYGNKKQKRAFKVLTKYNVFEKLDKYSPLLAGTIPIEIDIDGSDLDIICEVNLDDQNDFLEHLKVNQLLPLDADIDAMIINNEKCMVISFRLEEFEIEIFGQNKPTIQQNAYRHMIAEYRILKDKGEDFRQKIIELKKKGIKTEPAFGLLMNLMDPYEDLLKFYNND